MIHIVYTLHTYIYYRNKLLHTCSLMTPGLQEKISRGEYQPSLVAGALSMALCYARRLISLSPYSGKYHTIDSPQVPPNIDVRLLVFQISQDCTSSYIPMMNAIFAALGLHIRLDAIMLGDIDSIFLQQACYITKSVYTKIPLGYVDVKLDY